MTFVTEKLEWHGYSAVRQFRIYVYSFRQNPRTWRTDRQTDRHTDTAWRLRPRLHSIARQKNDGTFCSQIITFSDSLDNFRTFCANQNVIEVNLALYIFHRRVSAPFPLPAGAHRYQSWLWVRFCDPWPMWPITQLTRDPCVPRHTTHNYVWYA